MSIRQLLAKPKNLYEERRKKVLEEEFIDNFFDSKSEYDNITRELDNGDIRETLEQVVERISEENQYIDLDNIGFRKHYALVRKYQPATIVETGVRDGYSTLYILLAIEKNGFGDLYSIDYPVEEAETIGQFTTETEYTRENLPDLPSGRKPGWVIPGKLRQNWELIIGKSQRELPKLLTELGEIDFFFHDSDHSTHCMLFEFDLAWEWLCTDGILVSDDISWNDAFDIFVSERSLDGFRLIHPDIGILKKGE